MQANLFCYILRYRKTILNKCQQFCRIQYFHCVDYYRYRTDDYLEGISCIFNVYMRTMRNEFFFRKFVVGAEDS